MSVPVPPDPDVVPEELPETEERPTTPPATEDPELDPYKNPPRIR